MQRFQPRLSRLTQTRCFSSRSAFLAPRDPSRFDTEGRATGFARRKLVARRQAQQPSESNNQPEPDPPQNKNEKVSDALEAGAGNNAQNLLAPVHIPEDQHAILKSNHPSTNILANSSIVVQRQLEMMNVFLGFEQANKYIIMDPSGGHIGYMAEQEHGVGNMVARQMFKTHRSFTTHVFDRNEQEVLRFHRPFSWISSRIRAYDAVGGDMSNYSTSSALQGTSMNSITSQTSAQVSPLLLKDMRIIGEAQQQWAPLRRRYNLFLQRELSQQQVSPDAPRLTSGNLPLSESKALTVSDNTGGSEQMGFAQFAYVNEPFLSWDFSLLSADDKLIGSVNRNFAGWGRELFTDTGVYALRMEAAGLEPAAQQSPGEAPTPSPGMTLDQRAIMLATAVSIDFDYFSRHSSSGHGVGGFMPMWFPIPMGGGSAGAGAEGAEAAGAADAGTAAGEAGAIESGAGTAVQGAQNAARGTGIGEGAVTGAATMAGYEAMQRGRDGYNSGAQAQTPGAQPPPENMADDEYWDPWGGGPGGGAGGQQGGDGGSNGGGGGGDGGGFDVDDFF